MEHSMGTFSRRAIWLPVLIFPVLPLAIRCAVSGAPLAAPDLNLQFIPWWAFIRESLELGSLPWWNASCMLGYPALADPQTALFYPFNWMLLAGNVSWLITLAISAHVFLAGVFVFSWVKAMGLRDDSAVIAALAFQLSGFTWAHVSAGHFTMLCALPWLPAMLWQLEKHRRNPAGKHLAAAVFFWMVQFFAGHPQLSFFSAMALGIYAATHRRTLRNIRTAVLAGGLCLAAILGPVALSGELLAEASGNRTKSVEFIRRDRLPPENLAMLLVPDILGGFHGVRYHGRESFPETVNTLGLTALFLMFAGMGTRRRELIILAFLGVLAALGPGWRQYAAFLKHIPVIGAFRGWARSMFLFHVAGAGLIAAGYESIVKDATSLKRTAAAGIAVLTAATWVFFRFSVTPREIFSAVLPAVPVAAVIFARGRIPVEFRRRLLSTFVVAAAVWIFIPVAQTFITTGTPAEHTRLSDLKARLDEAIPDTASRVVFHQAPALINNYFHLGRDTLGGYRPLPLHRFERYFNLATGEPLHTSQVFAFPKNPSPFTRIAGVRYWIGLSPPAAGDTRRAAVMGPLEVYEDPGAYPRAWCVFRHRVLPSGEILRRMAQHPGAVKSEVFLETNPGVAPVAGNNPGRWSARYTRVSHTRSTITVNVSRDGWLVVSDAWYPGWKAFLDGNPVEMFPADYCFRCIRLPAGNHIVTMVYIPGWRRVAAWTPFIGLIGFPLWIFRKDRKGV